MVTFLAVAAATGLVAGSLALAAPGPGHDQAPGPRASASAISYSKARSILLAKVVKPNRLAAGDQLIAFGRKKPLARGTKVTPYRNRGTSLKLKRAKWFFWVDDDPKAQFEHPTRFVFIDARSGKVKVIKNKWWPLVNRRAPWFTPARYWKKSNWAYSNVDPPAATTARASASSFAPRVRAAASTEECVVLIAGSDDAKAGFPDDVDGMETVLGGTFKFTVKKLKSPDNDKADFEKAVDDLSKDGCKNMLLFIASHGGSKTVDMGTGKYSADDLKALMDKYPAMNFKVVVQGCKSGSWVAPLGEKPEIVITSTDATTPSYSADPDTEKDPNPGDKGSEFTSGLIEDLEAIHTDPMLLVRLQACIIGSPPIKPGKPPLVCMLEIAFDSALAKDEEAQAGKTHPGRKVK